eukprot:TRINITY_DN153326_c0_g1_i2.p2 TRINITY_DN153326_c0_g1~~TRINITY_DN153326_c0_g1_i2.p2  ORF type:complete len:106 (-),score=24.83 TRINITY_DN153326_c0_g1_i2:139-456(-)
MVIDIIDGFSLTETSFSKSDLQTYLKAYMKRVNGHLKNEQPERVDSFMDGAKQLAKKLIERHDDLQFFMNDQLDMDAMIVFAYYPDGDVAPRCIYIRDGLKEEKC